MIIDTVLIRDGEVIVKHDSGQETRLNDLLWCNEARLDPEHYRAMLHTLCQRLAALAVENDTHAQIGRADDE